MKAWEEYAYIDAENIVRNVAVFQINSGAYTLANTIAQQLFGEGAYAVNVTQYPVSAGYIYKDGHFFNGTTRIERVPTDEEEIAALKIANSSMNTAIDDIIIAVTPS